MKKLYLRPFSSPLHDAHHLEAKLSQAEGFLSDSFQVERLSPTDEVPEEAFLVDLILSGGSEGVFRVHAEEALTRPVLLLADGRDNSLAAALEILSWVQGQGGHAELLHGPSESLQKRLREHYLYHLARVRLKGPFGTVGGPSEWLIAGECDYGNLRRRWGSEVVEIPMEELEELYQALPPSAGKEEADSLWKGSRSSEIERGELENACRLLPALEELFKRYALKALTVRCFGLIESLATTGCTAFSLLNDRGLTCGCEGDLSSLFSMVLLECLSGVPSFMANPSLLEREGNRIVLAHCTVPTKIVEGYRLQSHFETKIGAALGGSFLPGPVTLLRVGGPRMDEFFLASGELLDSQPDPNLCRTRINLRLNRSLDYFFENPLGNHIVVVPGDQEKRVEGFCRLFNLRRRG